MGTTEISGREQVKSGFVGKRAASAYCALGLRTMDYARERGELPFYKVGKKVVYRMSDLDVFMARCRVAV
jgi:hypothetical protein